MTVSDRIVATLIAIVAVLMVLGLKAVLPPAAARTASVADSRAEPFP